MSLPVTPVKSKVHSALSMEQEMDHNLSRDIPYPLENELAIPQFMIQKSLPYRDRVGTRIRNPMTIYNLKFDSQSQIPMSYRKILH